MPGRQIVNKYKFVAGQTSPEDALTTASYPASGSYIDVSGYETVDVVIHLGAVHASDTPKFTLKQVDGTTGTEDTISTANCVHTAAATDDDEMIVFHLETAKLAANHHFITCAVASVSNTSYGDILYFLGGARHEPITQTTALLPTASDYTHAG